MQNHTGIRSRSGRALVECIVASMLLSIVALAVATTTRGSLALVSDAAIVAHAQAISSARAEGVHSGPCVASSTGTNSAPGVDVNWQQVSAGATSSMQVNVSIERSPIAFRRSASVLSMGTARNCQ